MTTSFTRFRAMTAKTSAPSLSTAAALEVSMGPGEDAAEATRHTRRKAAAALVAGGAAAVASTVLSTAAPAAAATVPTAPASCSATWARDGWSISWATPSSDGGSAIKEYRINEAGYGDPVVKLGATARTSTWISPLKAPKQRQFVIRARNAVGLSAACSATVPVSAVPLTVPAALQTTVSSQKVAESYGVAAHPNFQRSVYQNVDAWMSRLASMGATYFRGNYDPGNKGTTAAVAAARKYHLKWLMIVVEEAGSTPTTQTLAQTQARVEHIAANAADVVYAIQGVNEPNHNRGGGVVPPNWAQIATDHQRVIWQTAHRFPALAHVPIIGPSLQETNADASYRSPTARGGAEHYHQLVDAGIRNYQDYAGAHSYAGGDLPTNGLQHRLDLMRSAYGADYPIWIDESGYHNALATRGGHRPVSEEAAATYAPRLLLEFAGQRGLRVGRFEALDDVDLNAKDQQEANFGLWRVGSSDPTTWSEKPEVGAMRSILAKLEDPGPAYKPAPLFMGLTGPSDMEYLVTRKRDGSATLWLWRNVKVWDPIARTPITVPAVPITVSDVAGARTVQVAGKVVSVSLRA
jgi:hypothetical protein